MTELAPLFERDYADLPPDPGLQLRPSWRGFKPEHVRVARSEVGQYLAETILELGCNSESVLPSAETAISELVTNGLRYGITGVFAGILPAEPENGLPALAYVAVGDRNKRLRKDRKRPANIAEDKAEWGHGLNVVESIAHTLCISKVEKAQAHPRYRSWRRRSRKIVWATFILPRLVEEDDLSLESIIA